MRCSLRQEAFTLGVWNWQALEDTGARSPPMHHHFKLSLKGSNEVYIFGYLHDFFFFLILNFCLSYIVL